MCLVPALSIATSRHHVDPFHRWESFDVEGTEVRDLHGSCRGASHTVPPPHPLSLDPAIPTATVSATTISIAEDTSITSDCPLSREQLHVIGANLFKDALSTRGSARCLCDR